MKLIINDWPIETDRKDPIVEFDVRTTRIQFKTDDGRVLFEIQPEGENALKVRSSDNDFTIRPNAANSITLIATR